MPKNAIIVVPVYKQQLSNSELLSLDALCMHMHAHPISLVCPQSLDISDYETVLRTRGLSYRIDRFPQIYFKGREGYNRLMLSRSFYSRFKEYVYMLVYQLDCYLFSDQLDYWCKQGYQYIGAPWCQEGQPLGVGNGGFSLRHIPSFRKVLSSVYLLPAARRRWEAYQSLSLPGRLWGGIRLLRDIRRATTFQYFGDYVYNEDEFWSECAQVLPWFRVPDGRVASDFSFEMYPDRLYELTGRLPFGCHAWEKYSPHFWAGYIPCITR